MPRNFVLLCLLFNFILIMYLYWIRWPPPETAEKACEQDTMCARGQLITLVQPRALTNRQGSPPYSLV